MSTPTRISSRPCCCPKGADVRETPPDDPGIPATPGFINNKADHYNLDLGEKSKDPRAPGLHALQP